MQVMPNDLSRLYLQTYVHVYATIIIKEQETMNLRRGGKSQVEVEGRQGVGN